MLVKRLARMEEGETVVENAPRANEIIPGEENEDEISLGMPLI